MQGQLGLTQVFSIAAAVIAIIGFGRLVFQGCITWWRNTGGSRRVLQRAVERLEIGVSKDRVLELMGTPTMVEKVVDEEGASLGTVLRFQSRFAWISTPINEAGSVAALSISSQDSDLNIQLENWTLGFFKGRIGAATFHDAIREDCWPLIPSLGIGAHSHHYSETHYFGNPAGYRYYRASSAEGFVGGSKWLTDSPREACDQLLSYLADMDRAWDVDRPLPIEALTEIRRHAILNTLTIYRADFIGHMDIHYAAGRTETLFDRVFLIKADTPPSIEAYRKAKAALSRLADKVTHRD